MLIYIIEGIPDVHLRQQAKMLKFQKCTDLLAAFENITLEQSTPVQKTITNKPVQQGPSTNSVTQSTQPKCYNCKKFGHRSTECKKPKREKDSCFECGNMEHQVKNCPKIKPASTSNVVMSSIQLIQPFVISVKYFDSNSHDKNCNVEAIIDSGSPISLMKIHYVPKGTELKKVDETVSFYGIDSSKLTFLGIYDDKFMIENIVVNIKFYVVANDKIFCNDLLRRDFISLPFLRITLGKEIEIEKIETESEDKKEYDSSINKLINICYVEEAFRVKEHLKINPNLDSETSHQVHKLFDTVYLSKAVDDVNVKDWEMSINLTHEQPISCTPRQMAHLEKEKLQVILDTLLKDGIIRPSNSPYVSPIVLVRKKLVKVVYVLIISN